MRSVLMALALSLASLSSVAAQDNNMPPMPQPDPHALSRTFTLNTDHGHATALQSAYNVPDVAWLNWEIIGTADVNHDGTNDLIWIDRITQQLAVWYMSPRWYGVVVVGSALIENLALPQPPVGYQWAMTTLAPAGVQQVTFRPVRLNNLIPDEHNP